MFVIREILYAHSVFQCMWWKEFKTSVISNVIHHCQNRIEQYSLILLVVFLRSRSQLLYCQNFAKNLAERAAETFWLIPSRRPWLASCNKQSVIAQCAICSSFKRRKVKSRSTNLRGAALHFWCLFPTVLLLRLSHWSRILTSVYSRIISSLQLQTQVTLAGLGWFHRSGSRARRSCVQQWERRGGSYCLLR
jgi:hypothetical protein